MITAELGWVIVEIFRFPKFVDSCVARKMASCSTKCPDRVSR